MRWDPCTCLVHGVRGRGEAVQVCAVLPGLKLLLLGPVCCGHGPRGRAVSAASPYSLSDRWARRDLSGACTRAHACTGEWLVSFHPDHISAMITGKRQAWLQGKPWISGPWSLDPALAPGPCLGPWPVGPCPDPWPLALALAPARGPRPRARARSNDKRLEIRGVPC